MIVEDRSEHESSFSLSALFLKLSTIALSLLGTSESLMAFTYVDYTDKAIGAVRFFTLKRRMKERILLVHGQPCLTLLD